MDFEFIPEAGQPDAQQPATIAGYDTPGEAAPGRCAPIWPLLATDPDFTTIAAAWPRLPAAVRQMMAAVAQTSQGPAASRPTIAAGRRYVRSQGKLRPRVPRPLPSDGRRAADGRAQVAHLLVAARSVGSPPALVPEGGAAR